MIDPITLSALNAALDAASLRQAVGANNISQANVPGYQARMVDFEALLPSLTHGRFGAPVKVAARVVDAPVSSVLHDSGVVALDREVAALSRNAVQYQALLKALNGQLSFMDAALSGGKG